MSGRLHISFFGDDFTGSTDALEILSDAGLRTILFTGSTDEPLPAHDPAPEAVGIAGSTRAMAPADMERALRPALLSLSAAGAAIVHYKVCSTFDSAPHVGSIGRAIEVGLDVFGQTAVPVVAAAPSLGRYCAFGNLFARCGGDDEVFRIDRHPSMSRHPVTPMQEADLRLHLARQTRLPLGLIDLSTIERGSNAAAERFDRLSREGARIILIDCAAERHLPVIGALLSRLAADRPPLFVAGSSGVESALVAHWQASDSMPRPPMPGFATQQASGPRAVPTGHRPLLVISGSCSPVTWSQMQHAANAGFARFALPFEGTADDVQRIVAAAVDALHSGRSAIVHAQSMSEARGTDAGKARTDDPGTGLPTSSPPATDRAAIVGETLARAAQHIVAAAHPARLLVAGGDTSGRVARALEIVSLEMVRPLARGAPLCRASAPGLPADGMEVCFKGGQIGGEDLFICAAQTP